MRNGRIAAAACIFPVSQRETLDRSLGLRHRAGARNYRRIGRHRRRCFGRNRRDFHLSPAADRDAILPRKLSANDSAKFYCIEIMKKLISNT